MRIRALTLIVALLALAGCAVGAGDAERGRQLFRGEIAFASGRGLVCSTCHSVLDDGRPGLGPSLQGIAAAAAGRVPGQSAADYLRASILSPDAYLAMGYQEGIMDRSYAESLAADELRDLVAYLLTLE